MFANNIYNLLKYLTREGRINLDMSDEITASILISRDGRLVHAGALEAMGLK
jgi:NAD(P) transhydrogenase subunit alpha